MIEIDYSRDRLLSEQGLKLLKDYYMLPNEKSPQDAFARAALAYCEGDYDFAQRIYDYASNLWFMYSSPVLSNAPKAGEPFKSLPISCYLQYIPDTIQGQIEAYNEMASLSILGGGVGSHNGIRAISDKAPGPIPYMKTMDSGIGYYRQGKTRRGSLAYYMDIDHPDIIEHINFRVPTGGDVARKSDNRKSFHNAVNIKNDFIDAVINDTTYDLRCPHTKEVRETVKARDLWEMILETRALTGEPYLHFIDVANEHLPKTQKLLGLEIKGSNLCVAPETMILTDKGHYPIAELEDQEVNVWNGEEFSTVVIKKTNDNSKLIKVITDSGQEIECTEYHKFYVFTGYGKEYKEVKAADLKTGMKLIKFDLPVIEGDVELRDAYINGFYSGDGCLLKKGKNRQRVYLYGEKRDLAENFTGGSDWYIQEEYDRQHKDYDNLKEKFFVPLSNYTIKSRLDWLAGYADADGCIYRNGSNQQLVLASVEQEFLKEIQLLLQTLGVDSKIKMMRSEGYYKLPKNNGTGDCGDFLCKECWRLIITSNGLYQLLSLGIDFKRLRVVKRKPQRDAKRFIQIENVIDMGRIDETYCFNEPKRHMGMFGGILTGQCNEIELSTNEERTAVCCLSSVNLEKFDTWRSTNMIKDLIRFLDNVLNVFIKYAPDSISKARFSAMRERAIGLGTMGFHGYLMKNGIPFETGGFHSATQMNHIMFKHIKTQALEASKELAFERGEAPDMKGTGLRNSHLLAIAPNANSSTICNCTPSIEPISDNAYVHSTRAGVFLVKNKYLQNVLEEKDLSEEEIAEIWNKIIKDEGSVQNIDQLTEEEKNVFKTAWEIDQHWLVQHAEDRAQYICQGQSLNLFFPAGSDRVYVNSVYLKAMKGKKLKGLYYHRTKNKQQADTVKEIQREALKDWRDDGECVACQG